MAMVKLAVKGTVLAGEALPGDLPGVVFACGSALTDQDGNDQDVGFAPLAQLAQQLASLGLSSLRFDRRGVGRSPGEFGSAQEAIEDFNAVIQGAEGLVGEQPFLLGHGEGVGLAIMGALQIPCRGLILLAPPAASVRDLFDYQREAEELLLDAADLSLLPELQARYQSRKRLFMLKPLLRVNCPVLLVHGANDWVYPPAESEQIAAEFQKINQPATLKILDGLDHWFVHSLSYRTSSENLHSSWKVDPQLAQVIWEWTRSQTT
jgi:pimeloyl-ACP methyl ester carboxylesterase